MQKKLWIREAVQDTLAEQLLAQTADDEAALDTKNMFKLLIHYFHDINRYLKNTLVLLLTFVIIFVHFKSMARSLEQDK